MPILCLKCLALDMCMCPFYTNNTLLNPVGFYSAKFQMGMPNTTCLQLVTEGIVTVDNLEDFDEIDLKKIAENLH
jgi:hypothetical protein